MLMDYYFQSVLPAIPGLVYSEATGLIARAKDVSVKRYLIEYFILEYLNPSVSCMDEVFVKIFDYHDSLDDLEWMPAENRQEFRQLSAALKPNLCGASLPDLTLQSPSGDWRSLSDMDHDFRLVVIWDSECEHCVEQMETLNDHAGTSRVFGCWCLCGGVRFSSGGMAGCDSSACMGFCDTCFGCALDAESGSSGLSLAQRFDQSRKPWFSGAPGHSDDAKVVFVGCQQ